MIGGTKSAFAPWAVRMMVDGKGVCTATAVSDRWILGASHCFFDQPDEEFADQRITFRYGALDVRDATTVTVIRGSGWPTRTERT